MTFKEIIALKVGNLPLERLVVSDTAGRLNDQIGVIGTGVLFVYESWSASSSISFRLFCDAIAASPEAKFLIHVVNYDNFSSSEIREALGRQLQGNGEAFWIKDGRIVYSDNGYMDPKNLELLPRRIQEFTNS